MTAEKFGRYEIQSEIGRGGMATVYKAYDPQFDREVAIKVLPLEFLHDPQFRERFKREARTVALLEHIAIVPVYDFGEEDCQPYIVMRYMSGGSLADRLKKGPLPIAEAARIISRLGSALDVAHQRGVIHRDLKPGNILFDQYDDPFISDFGIARLAQEGIATITGSAIIGTPAYMSPEQVQGDKKIDGRSDIYALGIIAYEMISGKMPYEADTPAKVMMMHVLEPVPHLPAQRPDIPKEMDAILGKALAKNPDQRYATGQEFVKSLEAMTKRLADEYRTNVRNRAEGLMAQREFDQAIAWLEQARTMGVAGETKDLLDECLRRKQVTDEVRSLQEQHTQIEKRIREILDSEPWLPSADLLKMISHTGVKTRVTPGASLTTVRRVTGEGKPVAASPAAQPAAGFGLLEGIFAAIILANTLLGVALSQFDLVPTLYLMGLVALTAIAFSQPAWGKNLASILVACGLDILITLRGVGAGAGFLLDEYYPIVLLPYWITGLLILALAGLAARKLRSRPR